MPGLSALQALLAARAAHALSAGLGYVRAELGAGVSLQGLKSRVLFILRQGTLVRARRVCCFCRSQIADRIGEPAVRGQLCTLGAGMLQWFT